MEEYGSADDAGFMFVVAGAKLYGYGCEQDAAAAHSLFLSAGKSGHAEALVCAGAMHFHGIGCGQVCWCLGVLLAVISLPSIYGTYNTLCIYISFCVNMSSTYLFSYVVLIFFLHCSNYRIMVPRLTCINRLLRLEC